MFFTLSDNSDYTRGFAWSCEVLEPKKFLYSEIADECPVCKGYYGELLTNYYDREIVVRMAKTKATKWADIIPCSAEPFIVVSQRVLEAWEAEGIGTFPCFPVRVVPPFPKTLATEPPMYYRLDYKKMVGAEMDCEASGYVNARTCKCCGRFRYDLVETGFLQHGKIVPKVLKPATWNGTHLFYLVQKVLFTFCTDKVVDCAHQYKLTNFHFTPIEIAGNSAGFRGVDYSKKNWRQKLPEQIRAYEEYLRSLPPLPPDHVERVTAEAAAELARLAAKEA